MTPLEIVEACNELKVMLRINPDGKLTATPKRKLSDDLLKEIRQNRLAIIELLEANGKGAEVVIDDIPEPVQPKPSIGETIVKQCAAKGIKLYLDHPSLRGMLRIRTPWEHEPLVLPDAAADTELPPIVGRNRTQLPAPVAAQINNYRNEILAYLRSSYLPPQEPDDPANDPSKRNLWLRMAMPDNLVPGARDNQKRIRALLYGPDADNSRAAQRAAQAEYVMPLVLQYMNRNKGKQNG